jgi:hypothetical protein
MADPFTLRGIEKYKSLFQNPPRPDVLGTPAGLKALEAERSGLASFLGKTDYSAQNQEANDFAKLQFALSLMGRGFASMGAAPQPGENALGAVGRTLVAPLAGDISTISGPLMQQRAATRLAEQQEDRQLKLSALNRLQSRQDQARADDVAAADKARQFLMMAEKKSAAPSTDYTVKQSDGSFIRQVVTVETDWRGNLTYRDAEGKVIPANGIGVYTKPTAGVKPNIQKATDIEVMVKGPDGPDGSPGKTTYRPVNALITTTFRTDGSVGSTRMTEPTTGQVLVTSGPSANARMAPKAGSTTSLYYAPSTSSIFPTENFAEAFGLPSNLVGAKAELQKFTPKPDLGAGLPELQKIRVGGKTYSLQDHKNYNKGTGNIDLETEEGTQVIDASSLWRLEDPKAFVQVGDPLTVPSGSRLGDIRQIRGLENITGGETLRLERNPAGDNRLRYGNQTIILSPDESALFQVRGLSAAQQREAGQTVEGFKSTGKALTVGPTNLDKLRLIPGLENVQPDEKIELLSIEGDPALGIPSQFQYRYGGNIVNITSSVLQSGALLTRPLSETEKVAAGLVVEPRNTYVNTSDRSITVNGQTVGPGQTGAFSKTDTSSPAFLNVAGSFREVGPVSTDSKTYMFREPKTIGEVGYVPGDEVRYTPQEFANLPKDLQKILTDDTALQSATLKRNYFTSVWTDVTNREDLTPRDITEQDLQALLGMFPAGGRVGGNSLRDEIFAMIKFGPNANQGSGPTPASAEASAQAQTYAESVQQKLIKAGKRYEIFREKGALGDVPWGTLSYELQRAFADLPEAVQLAKINSDWQGSQDRLAKDKSSVKSAAPEDVAAFSSAVELLILAKQLRDSQDLDNTGRFTGFLGSLGVNTFGDISPLTSGGSQRLQQIINRMKASYGTLSSVEGGGGRDSVFRQQLQEGLLPAFSKPEKLNRDNLASIINRLETNIRSTFNQEITSSTVVPKTFEIMAKDAGITGVSVDQRRYRWLDPTVRESPPVTRQRVMEGINMLPFTSADATDLRVGRLLPVAANAPDKRYVKIKTLENGEVLIQEARPDGRPKSGSPIFVLGKDMKTRLQ